MFSASHRGYLDERLVKGVKIMVILGLDGKLILMFRGGNTLCQ